MRPTYPLTTGALGLGLGLILATAAPAQPPGEREIDKVASAYEQTRQYHATIDYTQAQKSGAFDTRRMGELRVAFDRDSNRLLIDDMDYLIVVKDGKLLARPHMTPKLHIEQPVQGPVTWATAAQAMPMVEQRPPVDLVMALHEKPLDLLSGGASDRATRLAPDPDDPQQRPRLQVPLSSGQLTLVVDPASSLVDMALVEVGQPGSPRSVAMIYDIHRQSRNQPLPDDLFAFDTTGSTAVADIEQLMQAAATGGGGGSGGGNRGPQAQRLPDMELPTLKGEPIKLAEIPTPAVVLAFITTWAPGSAEVVTQIETLRDWAEEQNQPVTVLLVGTSEPDEQIRQVLEGKDVQTPVLLDEQGQLAQALRVLTVPQVILLNKGEEVGRVGGVDNLADVLRQEITKLPAAAPTTLNDGESL